MRKRSAEQLVADVRKRADMVNSEFVDDEEILEYLNQEAAELRGRIRRAEGQPHKRSSSVLSIVAGTSLYNLPDDFAELLGIEAAIGGVNRRLYSFMEGDRAGLTNSTYYGTQTGPQYRIQGDQIELLPAQQTFTATIYYVPAEPRLTLGASPPSTLDGVQGYEMACVYGATATCLAKEESDASFYLAQKERILRHIDAMAAQRDGSQPERITEVIGLYDDDMPWW